jgi:hypothetical protein
MTKEEVLNDLKTLLTEAYEFAVEHRSVIKNSAIEQHIKASLNKWMGGANEKKINAQESQKSTGYTRYEPPKAEKAKKKVIEKPRVVAEDSDTKPLDQQTDSELKVTARELGIDFKNKNRIKLLKEIRIEKRAKEERGETMEVEYEDTADTIKNPPTELIENTEPEPIEDDTELVDEEATNENLLD